MSLEQEFSRPDTQAFDGLPPGHIAFDAKRADIYDAMSSRRFLTEGMTRAAIASVVRTMPPVEAQAFKLRVDELLPLSKMI